MLKNAGRNKEKSASFDALFLCQNAEISSLKSLFCMVKKYCDF